jgi:hypothetical protein
MTRRFSISLPDDVAVELDRVENASAFIADCIRQRRRRDVVRKVLADAGYEITDEGVERMRQRLHELERRRRERLKAERAERAERTRRTER